MPQVKVIVGKYYRYLNIEPASHNRYKLTFNFDRELIAEVKCLESARWNPDEKCWYIANSPRNHFALDYMIGKKPYAKWEQPIKDIKPKRDCLMPHQVDMFQMGMTYKQVILAAEPGCGKTLSAIEIMEASKVNNWLWVGPKSALRAVEQEFSKWESMVYPEMVTYDSLKKYVSKGNIEAICFDEAQKIRNSTTQRFQAAKIITDAMRDRDPYILELTGTPAPHDPTNWWGLCEIVAPGFVKEGSPRKFKERLALVKNKESLTGGFFPELITYWDDENKCKVCGQYITDLTHDPNSEALGYDYHEFVKSKNEVQALYYRLKGLVGVWLKKDVLKDLPEKVFRIIECKPSPEVLRAAKLIVANAKNVISGNILLRELSDGFQYQQVEVSMITCPLCHGRKTIIHQDIDIVLENCPSCEETIENFKCLGCGMDFTPEYSLNEEMTCPSCAGEGEVPKYERQANQVECPKEEVLKDLLDEYEEIGRVVIFAGFQGSIDRCIKIVSEAGWEWMKIDGRGWTSSLGNVSDGHMLRTFQDKKRKIPRFASIGNPDAGGLGLSYTESPVEIYYSNSHIPESRMQSEERIHRPGADINKGCTIIDIIHLPSDLKVLEALRKSKKLQSMSLGEFARLFD